MDAFPIDLLIERVIPFVGNNQFRYVAAINRTFYKAYTSTFPNTTTTLVNLDTVPHAQIFFTESPPKSEPQPPKRKPNQPIDDHEFFTILVEVLTNGDDFDTMMTGGTGCVQNRPLKQKIERLTPEIVQSGNLELLILVHRYYSSEDYSTTMRSCRVVTEAAVENGQLEILKWAHTTVTGFKWNVKLSSRAAQNGHFEILKWVHANSLQWDMLTCSSAALNGHLEILQWVRSKACPWNEYTCSYAAKNGHLNVLQWARGEGCPWDQSTCSCAASNGHLDVLKWARANGCPWDYLTLNESRKNGHVEVYNWAKEKWSCF